MTGSLLSLLAPQVKISMEDIATLSLYHIIRQSEALTKAFSEFICSHLGLSIDDISIKYYKTQVTGKDKERPDIVGFDEYGKKELICEAKFYAALTDNQPVTYLERLAEECGKGLVFLCPKNRMFSLWQQVCQRVEDKQFVDSQIISWQGVRMGVLCWEDLLDRLNMISEQHGDVMKADILELEVFCKQIIKSEFIPFKEEDFGADVAISMDRYFIVVDKLNDYLVTKNEYGIVKGKLGAGRKWESYAQYLTCPLCNIAVYFDRNAWQNTQSKCTPFWMSLQVGVNWIQDKKILHYLNTIPEIEKQTNKEGIIMIALYPPVGLTLEESMLYLAEQVLKRLDEFKAFSEGQTL